MQCILVNRFIIHGVITAASSEDKLRVLYSEVFATVSRKGLVRSVASSNRDRRFRPKSVEHPHLFEVRSLMAVYFQQKTQASLKLAPVGR